MQRSRRFLFAVGCLALPTICHADSATNKGKSSRPPTAPVVVTRRAPVARPRMTIYITREPRTGSQIPMVYRSYNGHIDSASNAAVYGTTDLARTGALDIGTSLSRLDPSFSVRGRR